MRKHQHLHLQTSSSTTTTTAGAEETLSPSSYIINSKELTTMIKGIDTRYHQPPPTRSSAPSNSSHSFRTGQPEPTETSSDTDRPSKPRRLRTPPPPTTTTTIITSSASGSSDKKQQQQEMHHHQHHQHHHQQMKNSLPHQPSNRSTTTSSSAAAASKQKLKKGRSRGSTTSPQPYDSHDFFDDDDDESSVDDDDEDEEEDDTMMSPTYTTYTTAGTEEEEFEYNTESEYTQNTDYDSLYDDLSVEENSTYSSSCKGLATPTPTFDLKKELGLGLLGLGREEEEHEEEEEGIGNNEGQGGQEGGGTRRRSQEGDRRTSPYNHHHHHHHEEKKEQQEEDTKIHIIEDVPDDDVTAFTKEKEEQASNHQKVLITDSPTHNTAFSSSLNDGSSGGTAYNNNNNPNNISMTSTQATSQYNLLYRLKTNDSSLTHLHLDPDVLERAGGATNIVNAIFFDDGNVSRNRQFLSELTISDMEADYSEAEESFMILCRIIAKGPNLHTLNLVNCQFDRHLANMLGLALSKKAGLIRQNMVPGYSPTPISRLAIRQCNFERATCAMAVIFMGISHLYNQLQHLTIEMSGNGGFIPDVVFGAMPLLKLHSLTLINTNLSANDLEFLYPNLEATSSTLKELNLSQTHVLGKDPFCLKQLLECVIAPNSNIEKLTLQDCSMSYESMKLFPFVLGTKLSLVSTTGEPSSSSSVSLSVAGSTTSAFALVSPPSCTQPQEDADKPPSLVEPEQPQQQQQQQLEVKKNSMKLRAIDLSYNPGIGDKGVRALLELMKLCPNITDLKVDDCGPLSKTVLSKLDDKLRYNNSFLQKIGLSSDVSLAILDSVQLIRAESFNIFEATRNKAAASQGQDGNASTSNRGSGGKERNKLGSYSSSTSTRSSLSARMDNSPPMKRTAIPEDDTIEPDRPDKSSIFGSFLR